jgi:hypothetical protein
MPVIKPTPPKLYNYDDYAAVSFTSTETSYTAGTNANSAKTGTWPSGTYVKDTLLYADQDCKVRFDAADKVQHFIPKETFIRYTRLWRTLYIIRDTADGTLKIWMEG